MTLEQEIGRLLESRHLTLSTAESCTGGAVAALITSVPGSSAYFNGAVVAYTNEVKQALLHVSPVTLRQYGAVSRETVIEMAKGAMEALKTDCAVATSGIAGPGGGTVETPTGTIWMAVATPGGIVTYKQTGDEGRGENVRRAVGNVLGLLCDELRRDEKKADAGELFSEKLV